MKGLSRQKPEMAPISIGLRAALSVRRYASKVCRLSLLLSLEGKAAMMAETSVGHIVPSISLFLLFLIISNFPFSFYLPPVPLLASISANFLFSFLIFRGVRSLYPGQLHWRIRLANRHLLTVPFWISIGI